MSNSFKPVADILTNTPSVSTFLIDADSYYAHISPKCSSQPKEPEILAKHIELVQYKFRSLVEKHHLDIVIDKLIVEYLAENGFDNNTVICNYVKKLFVNTIVFHDYGKINENFQVHPDKMNNPFFKGKEKPGSPISTHHSSLGAYLFIVKHLEEINQSFLAPQQGILSLCALALAYTVFKHHGKYLGDNITEKVSFSKAEIDFMKSYIKNYQYLINDKIAECPQYTEKMFDEFFFGKYINSYALYSLIRLNFSLLTASDYLASSEYMTDIKVSEFGILEATRIDQLYEFVSKSHWLNLTENKKNYNKATYEIVENYVLQNPKDRTNHNLNILRQEMAVEVIRNVRANKDKNLFYIDAPTGGGKTNLSMLATLELLKANEGKINKVYYVFPFTTLITQTYKAITETLGLKDNEVTQLHSKAGYKSNEESNDGDYGNDKKNYIDNLFVNYPFTLMTHIKFFDILKTNEKESNYLLHRLANSVVIIDELQSYNPRHWDKIIYFIRQYARFYNIKFILMSATLPKLDKLKVIKVQSDDFIYLLPNAKQDYFQNPNFSDRVAFDLDLFDRKDLQLEELADLLLQKSKEYAGKDFGLAKPLNSIYTIIEFIFKKSASEFYRIITEKHNQFFDEIFVLSGTILEHRRKHIINYLKNQNNRKKKILLITTQVVEAGVDIDMDLGFKDKSLIDSDEQLAGRINRNVNKQDCRLYLFNYNRESIIYGKDKRYELTQKYIDKNKYKAILKNKNFDLLYDLVMNERNEWNTKEMAVGFDDYERKILKLRFQSVHFDFKLIDQENISCFLPIEVPVKVNGLTDNSFDDIFSSNELTYLAKNDIFPNNNGNIEGGKIFDLYIHLFENKQEFTKQKIAEKTLQGIMSKFIFSLFASKTIETQIVNYSDAIKSAFGYKYLHDWQKFYNVNYGMDDKAFNSNETQFL